MCFCVCLCLSYVYLSKTHPAMIHFIQVGETQQQVLQGLFAFFDFGEQLVKQLLLWCQYLA